MDNLISLVNKIQRACTALGDHGEASALPTLWDSLPAIAVVGGQVTFRIPALLFRRLLIAFDRVNLKFKMVLLSCGCYMLK
ncbi:unnamed protein product [Linum tenue]|uniref:Uncharacterized protein n=1 Tax=Linum tenue TaxID=586396 RepID=A0AAV0JIA9_9ROSI|nr:unnamed protein product [Linum tenue]